MEKGKAEIILNQFNETIEKWIRFLDEYSLEMLCTRPDAGSWSLGQVYVHIIADTGFFIDQMKACISGNVNSEKEMHADAKIMFENNAFPGMQLSNPSNSLDLRQPQSKKELLHALLRIKDEVNKLYNTGGFSKSKGKTKHPELLFFNAMEWLQFAEIHMRHHLRQKARIDEKLFILKQPR